MDLWFVGIELEQSFDTRLEEQDVEPKKGPLFRVSCEETKNLQGNYESSSLSLIIQVRNGRNGMEWKTRRRHYVEYNMHRGISFRHYLNLYSIPPSTP